MTADPKILAGSQKYYAEDPSAMIGNGVWIADALKPLLRAIGSSAMVGI